jgi:hypothetical protein
LLELLEARDVPSAFVPGSIQGQDGWSGGSGAIAPGVDQAVVQGSVAHFGVGAWHVSNDTSNGNYNGGFGGWVFSPGLSVAAGQPSSGAGADRFSATFFFRSASTVADGSNIEVDLGNTAGNDRTTFMAITNKADGNGGLQLRMAEPNPSDPANDYFYPTQIVATNIARGAWHRIDIQAAFVDGAANDTFQVSLDGVAMLNMNAASPNWGTANWGTFEAYNAAHDSGYNETNRLFFRSGGAPSDYGSFSDTGAQGFYIDDVSYKDWNSSAPTTILASYAATFEPAVTPPSTVYVNASWAGLPIGVDPDGAGPATDIGYDAFATIQDALNAVATGGTVHVAAGTYAEHVLVNKTVTLLGAENGVHAPTRSGAESVVDGGGYTPFYVTASDVTIDGFTVQGATNGNQFGYGILLAPGTSGAHVVNDIIQGNIAGLGIENADSADSALVQYNLFQNNTVTGPAGGTDIYADQYTAGTGGVNKVLIDSNTFTNSTFTENAWALGMSNTGTTPFSGITFSHNTVTNHGRGVYFYATTSSTVTDNTITGASHYAIGLFGSNGSPANSSFTISGNTLTQGTGGAGVELANDTSASAYTGTLTLADKLGLLVVDVKQEVVKTRPGVVHYGDTEVDYSNVSQVNIDNAMAVNAMPGPDTADRATAFAGLNAAERFVQALYLDELGRPASSKAALDLWLPYLRAPGGQQAVARGIKGTFEARDRLVKTWNQTYLGGAANGKEELGWVAQLGAGYSEEQVLSQILGSPEFYSRAQTLGFGDTPQGNYIRALYQVLLDRKAGNWEVAVWVTVLSRADRTTVALSLLRGTEFRTAQFEGYYNALLRRPSAPYGLNGCLSSNLDIGTVRIAFESSPEFYKNG